MIIKLKSKLISSVKELTEVLSTEWLSIKLELCNKLVFSMPKKIHTYIANHGKPHRCHNIHKLGNDKLHVKITARRISQIYREYPEKLRFLSAFGVTRWIPK